MVYLPINEMEIEIADLPALDAFARTLARRLQPGSVVALHGQLGAGKTTLVRALLRELHGSDAAASSPTFVFRQRYDGRPPIEHLDLYRLATRAELDELGLEDAFAPDRITFVEWADRAPELLPADAIAIEITGSGGDRRRITISER